MPSFIHLSATKFTHKNLQETYVHLAVVLLKVFANCAHLDTWADKIAQSAAQECVRIKFSSGHTGSCHLIPNWNNPDVTTPNCSRQLPHWTQSSSNVSPHPTQAVNEVVEVDGMGRLGFRLALFYLTS
jgi:hypothetical protein